MITKQVYTIAKTIVEEYESQPEKAKVLSSKAYHLSHLMDHHHWEELQKVLISLRFLNSKGEYAHLDGSKKGFIRLVKHELFNDGFLSHKLSTEEIVLCLKETFNLDVDYEYVKKIKPAQ